MEKQLTGKKVAILVDNGFEQSEMTEPRKALDEAGAETHLISPADGKVKGWKSGDWADSFDIDVALDEARSGDYDALVLPGGVINPDKLRINETAVRFIHDFFSAGKPVAAICHGPWTLINAGVVKGREMTSWPSLRKDLENAGARWVDREVVVDAGLVTSRNPDDLPAFNAKLVEEVGEGVHREQRKSA